MSDTPRVDALDFGDQSIFTDGDGYGQLWELARQLERELAGKPDAIELAEQWKGRADDAGRLSRAVLGLMENPLGPGCRDAVGGTKGLAGGVASNYGKDCTK